MGGTMRRGRAMLCWLRWGAHSPARHPLGGFRCQRCKKPAADLGEMGYEGYVSRMRRQFSRQYREVTRSYGWEGQ